MAEQAQRGGELPIRIRFLDLFFNRFIGTMKHLWWHIAILGAGVAYDFWTLGSRAFVEHFWEATVPIVWIFCVMVIVHSVQVAVEIIKSRRADAAALVEVDSRIVSELGTAFRIHGASTESPRFLRLRVWGTASIVIGPALGFSFAVWLLARPPTPTPTPVPTPTPEVGLFMDCAPEGFPIRIPQGTTAHILRIHPVIAKRGIQEHLVRLLYAEAASDEDRVWPSDEEAPPLPRHTSKDAPVRTGSALNCTIRKYGNGTADLISIPLEFGQDKYNVVIEPLDSSGTFDRFSFHILNACYVNIEPNAFVADLPAVLANFPNTATLRVLGQANRKPVPLTVSFRDNAMPIIFLDPVYRRWRDLPPC